MLYPVYVHLGDDGSAHGATIPDFPGCFSAADDWDDLPANVQEAVELYCDGEDMDIPTPSGLAEMVALERKGEYEGGTWVMIDIDLSKLDTRMQRINISLPANALREIDAYARAHDIPRSRFLVNAAIQVARGKGGKRRTSA